jgi:ribonuclease P protein component
MRRSLTKGERLKKRKDIARIFRSSLRISTGGLTIFFRGNDLKKNRMAVTTTKRGYKGSVERNREKRIGKEIYRTEKHTLRQGFDMVLVLKPGSYSFKDRMGQFRALTERAGLNLFKTE